MQRHVIVLAANVQEGVTYARRKGLPARSYRSPARAASIRGIRNCEVHVLPTFHGRRDAHAILAELRYAQCEFIDVEMPEPLEPAPIDQGDGMGEQLDILAEVRVKALEDFARSELISKEQNGTEAAAPIESEDPAPAPKAKPRKRNKPAPVVAGMFD